MTNPVPAPEQQGEPVCARCGRAIQETGGDLVLGEWEHVPNGWGDLTDQVVEGFHHAEPAPPLSEKAEARRVNTRGENTRGLWPGSTWSFHNAMGEPVELFVPAPVEAAIRRPIEEERDRLQDIADQLATMLEGEVVQHDAAQSRARADAADAQVQELIEERDRALDERDAAAMSDNDRFVQVQGLRAALLAFHAAGEVDGRNRLLARAETAEAELSALVARYSATKERRVQLELALRGIVATAKRNGGGSTVTLMSGYTAIIEQAERALAAHQEEGESNA